MKLLAITFPVRVINPDILLKSLYIGGEKRQAVFTKAISMQFSNK